MTARQISPVATLVAAARKVPWSWPPIVQRIRYEYRAAGRNQSELARRMDVPLRTVQQWFADDDLRAEIESEEWNAYELRLAVTQAAAGQRQKRLITGQLPWTGDGAERLLGRVRRSLDRWGFNGVEATIRGERLVLSQGKNELEI